MRSGPIIVIEDDIDDREVLEAIFTELHVKNKLIWFVKSDEAFNYLKTTSDQPLIILCDVNLPVEDGVSFKRRIDADPYLRKKSIPFVFYSTSVDQQTVNEAYTKMTVQGFFQKANKYEEIKKTVKLVLDYWLTCRHPNST
jgi:CheY-like chemotaxis protein